MSSIKIREGDIFKSALDIWVVLVDKTTGQKKTIFDPWDPFFNLVFSYHTFPLDMYKQTEILLFVENVTEKYKEHLPNIMKYSGIFDSSSNNPKNFEIWSVICEEKTFFMYIGVEEKKALENID
jgi:hypothetical protein